MMANMNTAAENRNGARGGQSEGSFEGDVQSLIEWLNSLLPSLNFPLDSSVEELRAFLINGTVLCNILNELRPGLIKMSGNVEPGPEKVKKFLVAMDEMGLPRFVLADIQQGYMVPVLQCLRTLKFHFEYDGLKGIISSHAQKRRSYSVVEFSEDVDHSQGDAPARRANSVDGNLQHALHDSVDANILELMKSTGLDNASTQTMFNLVNSYLDESIEKRNGHMHQTAPILKKVVQAIEWRVSTQAENLKDQNKLYKAHMEKYQSRIKVLESIAAGSKEEIEVLVSRLQQIKSEKRKIEEKENLEKQDLLRLKAEKNHSDLENATLKHELEVAKISYEEQFLLLEAKAQEAQVGLGKKLKELESFLAGSRNKLKELESFSESKTQTWKKKEGTYQGFLAHHYRALQELKEVSNSMKNEVLKTKRTYSDDFCFMEDKLKGLADAAEKYHSVLAENRKLYNEVQDLKGNIRVYCRIRPFPPDHLKKLTTIEYIGDNGELIVSNPTKQTKDSHKLFKFSKVFGPATSQVFLSLNCNPLKIWHLLGHPNANALAAEVFLDTRPLIRSVLDGYNVCIFAYGQTGSGKTYTMSGPNISEENWGVNYRALHDLFQISHSRKSSISYEVGVQMVEIYNEQVRDLLSSDGSRRRLGIWNTTLPNGLAVPDAFMYSVASTNDVLELMNIGSMNRAVGATALNERSSRSHSVLTVHVCGTDLKTGVVFRGNLHLIDLAGSERVDRSEATGERLREAQHINKSLSALGDVIFALAQKSPHVPYRNSKLTQVLQSSLGGHAKTLMFVQLNPDVESYSETVSTLKFAERVSGVELGAARSNKEGKDVRELMEQVSLLKDTIAKKDEEIERLKQLKGNIAGVKCGRNTLIHESSSPRRYSVGSPRQSPRFPRGKSCASLERGASDMDRSGSSGKHSETDSLHSVDDFRHSQALHRQTLLAQSKSTGDLPLQNECTPQQKRIEADFGQKSTEDVDLLGFGDADADERLSDISDGGLSMGTETDRSLGSAVEFALFPESAKPPDAAKPSIGDADTEKPTGKTVNGRSFASMLPKPSEKLTQTRVARLSLAKTSSPKVSAPKVSSSMSASRKHTFASSSASKPVKKWS